MDSTSIAPTDMSSTSAIVSTASASTASATPAANRQIPASAWSAVEDDEVGELAPLKPVTSTTMTSARRRSSNLSTRSSISAEYVRTGRRTPSMSGPRGGSSVGITDIATTMFWLVPVIIKTTASLVIPNAIRGRLRGRA